MIIFETTTLLQQYITVANSFDIETLIPHERSVLQVFIPKWFTSSVVDEILTGAAELPETDLNKMYHLFLGVVANEMMLQYSFTGEVQISDLGISRHENENSKAAYSGQIKTLRASFKSARSENLSALISLIESSNEFTTLAISTCGFYRKRSTLIVNKSEDFNDVFPLEFPALTFFELIPMIQSAQILKIKPRIGRTVLNSLIANASTFDISDLKSAIVFFTVADALVSGLAKISSSGTLTIHEIDETSENSRTTATTNQASPVYHQYIKKANQYLDEFYKQLIEDGIIVSTPSLKNRFIA